MSGTIARKTVRDWRGGAIGVALTAAIVAFLDVLIYPEYREMLEDLEGLVWVQGFVGDAGSIASPEGFLAMEFFSWIPLVLITLAVIAATGAIAGEEGDGTLELVLAQPVSRRRLLWEKAAGIGALLAACALAGFPAVLVAGLLVDFDLGAWPLLQAMVNMLPVTWLFLALALWAAAALPTRASAASLTIGILVTAYFVNMIGASVDSLESVRRLSPFYWSDGGRVLVRGLDPARAGGLLAVAGLLMALATRSFQRREISGGAREWSWRGLLQRGTVRPAGDAVRGPGAGAPGVARSGRGD